MDISTIIPMTQKQNQFQARGIHTVEDLLHYFPQKYADFSRITRLSERPLELYTEGAFLINVKDICEKLSPKIMIPYVCMEGEDADSHMPVRVYWFGQKLIYKTFQGVYPGTQYFVAGKAKYNYFAKNYTINSPTVFTRYIPGCEKIYPIYKKIPGMSDTFLRESIEKALVTDAIKEEPYDPSYSSAYGFPSAESCIRELHHPKSTECLDLALNRMKFDILVDFCETIQKNTKHKCTTSPFVVRGITKARKILASLPYRLTPDQVTVIHDVLKKMQTGQRVEAMLQADVGAGKTMVSALIMAVMAENGHQSAFMAPSKVLAQQHYSELKRLMEPVGIRVVFCQSMSTMKKKEKKSFLEAVKSGEANIIVGTHSLLSDLIEFNSLGLIVTDEEHKFGVLQKEYLSKQADQGVHSIMMSATPIPRTLVQVIYGDDMELYTIRTMPKGRVPVQTNIVSKYEDCFAIVERELNAGHQAFVVCPQIDASEKTDDIASVKEVSDIYMKHFSGKGKVVMALTGKTKKEESDRIIQDFANKKIDILVATTVVEVGVNVPNATVIVIQNAERFGLSSLHQLRGRVGRSSFPSYCLLFSEDTYNSRLRTMVKTTDGFEIAKADMETRGPGDWIGIDQSGRDSLPVQLMLVYPELYDKAKELAGRLIEAGA